MFDCDACVSLKLTKRNYPYPRSSRDKLFVANIRRMIWGDLWSRTKQTVETNPGAARRGLDISAMFGITPLYLPQGPLPDADHCGYGVALQILAASREPGRNHASYQQLDTIRALRTVYTNQVWAPGFGILFGSAHGTEGESRQEVYNSRRPMCIIVVGQDVRSNIALSVKLIHALLDECLVQSRNSPNEMDQADWVKASAYFATCYVTSLCGPNAGCWTWEG
jgi:hypothetical protein